MEMGIETTPPSIYNRCRSIEVYEALIETNRCRECRNEFQRMCSSDGVAFKMRTSSPLDVCRWIQSRTARFSERPSQPIHNNEDDDDDGEDLLPQFKLELNRDVAEPDDQHEFILAFVL